jgi:predicted MFS family arabinose efflux permease
MTSEGQVSRWAPIAGFVLVASANQMLWLNFTPITTGASARLAVSKSAIGWLSEIFPLLYVFLALPVGRALDRWFRPTLCAGGVLTAAGAVLRLGGRQYAWLLAGQLLIAVAQPAVLNAITATATRYLSEGHRPIGIAVGSAGTFLGFILAFVLGGALGSSHLHTILVISAVYSILALAALLFALRTDPGDISTPGSTEASIARIRELLSDRVLRTLSMLVFLGFGVFIALTTWLETLLKPAGVSSATTDTLLTAMVICGVVGCVVIPPIAAKRSFEPTAIAAAAAAIGVGCLLLAADPGTITAGVAMPVLGLLVLPVLPVILELAERRAGPAGGTATAVLWLAGNGGGIVVALVTQTLQNSRAAAFAVLAVIGCAAIPLSIRLRKQLESTPVV